MIMAKQTGMKDPFASPVLPKSFYHPTPSRGVDTNIAITAPERELESNISPLDAHFLKGSSSLIPALAHLHPFPSKRQHDVRKDFNTSNRSGDHFHETWPESEQPSATSFHGDISPFTSVSAEAENEKLPLKQPTEYSSGRYSGLHGDRDADETPAKSVLQKYIERFRNAEPKSRTERSQEKESNYRDFWWMHSSPSSPADVDSQSKQKQLSLVSVPAVNKSQSQGPYERKLTKEAVMELDKETSQLQSKADHILTKSQLSLASSGPIVSTQGLGSSTSISEYSLKSDSQVPYRPAFVNIREHSSVSSREEAALKAHYKQHEPSQEVSSPPGDILAKWRLRRKMEETKSYSTRSMKPFPKQGGVRNREMDVRLEEFRKKLFSQRALVTQEEIQYERQKMKMLREEDNDKIYTSQDKETATLERNNQSHGADPILVRLKSITGTISSKPPMNTGFSDENTDNVPQLSQDIGNIPKKLENYHKETDNSIHMDSNLNNACFDSKPLAAISESYDDTTWSLNKNNTSNSVENDSVTNEKQGHIIDNMTSVVLCDPTKKYVALDNNSKVDKNVCIKCNEKMEESNSSTSERQIKERIPVEVSSEKRNVITEGGNHTVASIHPDGPSSAQTNHEDSVLEKQVYHQYLVAEKPSVEVTPKGQGKSEEEGDGSSSEMGEKRVKKNRVKKKETKGKDIVVGKKDKKTNKVSIEGMDKEDSLRLETDSSSVASQQEDAPLSKVPSDKIHTSSYDECPTELDPKDIESSLGQSSHVSHTPVSKGRKQISNSRSGMSSNSSSQQNIQKAVIQTVADHLFDGPSVISSVDSWASLFPQSPGPTRALYDSDLASPSPHRGYTSPMQSTPTQFSSLAVTETDLGSSESDEFEDDPLLSLLRQQKIDYVKKLEAIESALMKLER